jgi:hypothetical protein
VVEDLEEGDDAGADAEAEETGRVGYEEQYGHLLVGLDEGEVGVLDEDVHDGEVLLGVDVEELDKLLVVLPKNPGNFVFYEYVDSSLFDHVVEKNGTFLENQCW